MDTKASAPLPQLAVRSFDGPLGRNIIETHIWAVREGLRGASAYDLFDGYCQRLVIHGVPLWRARAASRASARGIAGQRAPLCGSIAS